MSKTKKILVGLAAGATLAGLVGGVVIKTSGRLSEECQQGCTTAYYACLAAHEGDIPAIIQCRVDAIVCSAQCG